jgi:hypothetical protein
MDIPPALSRILPGEIASDNTVIALLTANIITIFFAIAENWNPADVLFIYWAQSVIIGAFAVVSILSSDTASLMEEMNRPDPDGVKKPVWTERSIRYYLCVMAGFFCLHYGLFHWGYYSFIVESGLFGTVGFSNPGIWISCGLFFSNHLYSFLWHRKGVQPGGVKFVNEEFFRPYNRIIPMHLTIIFGSIVVLVLQLLGFSTLTPVLVLFLVLKTYMDLKMHLRKHYEEMHPDEPEQFIVF